MPALFSRDTNTPTMSGANPFQSSNANAVAAGQENQTTEAQQHKQVLEKKAAADKKYVQANCCRKGGMRKRLHSSDNKHSNTAVLVANNPRSNPLYVSPSDNIMSPASQKLSSFKQRQINKQ